MIGETDTQLFFNVFLQKKQHAFYWDKTRRQLHAVHMTYPADWQVDEPFIPQALSTDGCRLIGYVKSDTDENPVLVVATL